MGYKLKSILDNVVYLHIETTGFSEENSEIIDIGIVKVKNSEVIKYSTLIRPSTEELSNNDLLKKYKKVDLMKARTLQEVEREIVGFLEDLPIICHNPDFIKRFLRKYIPRINNEFLNSKEFSGVLEPWRREYTVETLLNEITDLKDISFNNALDQSINILFLINALLCRQWTREEMNDKKKKSMYLILTRDYSLLNRWPWVKYLEKPLIFTYEGYEYVNYEEDKVIEPKLEKVKIDYNKFEELLKEDKIWNNGEDFKFQYRDEQRILAKRIRENIENEERILIEAPTGSGKTFAYVLIAALKAYINSGTYKVEDASFIISTDTKELQNQLIRKDIPNILLKLGLNKRIKYGAIKGKSNYICTEKLIKAQCFNGDLKSILAEIFLKRLCKDGSYGDIENINYWAYIYFGLEEYMPNIVCDNDECNLEKCYRNCYLKKRYLELPLENITVVNHSLLASWPYGEKKKITHLIIDEAHNLMEKCYDFFSEEFISNDFQELLKGAYETEPTIYRQLNNLNASYGYREVIDLDKIKYWVKEIETYISILLNKTIELKLAGGEYNFRTEYYLAEEGVRAKVILLEEDINKIKEKIYGLYALLNKYINNITLEGEEGKEDNEYITLNNYVMTLKSAFEVLDAFLENPKERKDYAKVLEVSKDYSYFKVTNIPLNIDELFNEKILKEVKSTTFLSATMRSNNSFKRSKYILGQREAKEIVIAPTFNLKKQTKIFIVKDIGPYNSINFISNSAKFIFEVSKKIGGHILVLFTNNFRKKRVEEELLKLVKGTDIEIHTHKKSIKYLKDKYKKVIILGSKGFFEGIDVPGDALTCVMIDKIPNKSLEDPLLKALTTYKRQKYMDVNYPNLCIKLKQVYGRLIRSIMDYGYFCILDGGQNNQVLYRLERDLKGPTFMKLNSNIILKNIDCDYKRWKMENLNLIIKGIDEKNISDDIFNKEAKKRNSFWVREEKLYGKILYKNDKIIVVKNK